MSTEPLMVKVNFDVVVILPQLMPNGLYKSVTLPQDSPLIDIYRSLSCNNE